jgi:thiol:disulfide interchange protein DsbD
MTAPSRLLRLLLPLLFCLPAPAWAIDESDLLPVDDAFALTARATGPDAIAVEWRIAEGYYLYRHRMSAEATGGAQASALALPRGKAHTDEFFGRVETFRDRVRGTLTGVGGAGVVNLQVKYQGCADLGICYPPQTRTLQVAMPGSAPPAAPASEGLAALARALTGQPAAPALPGTDALPLPPERAFGFEAIPADGNTLLLRFTPISGYYLYRDRTTFRLEGAPGIATAQPRWPAGKPYRDEYFGRVTVYFDQIDVPLPLARRTAEPANATLVATFQGCQTGGICYPPMTRRVALSIPGGKIDDPQAPTQAVAGAASAASPPATQPGTTAAVATVSAAPPASSRDDVSASAPAPGVGQELAAEAAPTNEGSAQAEDERLAGELSGRGRWLALLGFFGAGLLLAFTPCVLPMIPILSGLIAGRGERIGAGRAFALSLVYVLANAVVFTIAGVVAGLLGANLQIAFQTPWVLVLFAALFVALSLSMFGLYELQLPAAWRARLGAVADSQRGGSWAGVAAMGALSALIVGPCVAPPLAAAVLYIGQAQDPVFGGLALFVLAMGMGTPLLAFGVAAGRGLPTSGPWMVAVQRMFGFVFVGMAVWMLSRLLPGAAALALYGMLALAFATWLMFQASAKARPAMAEGPRWALRCAGVVFGIVGAAQLTGAMAGGQDPLRPLAGVFGAPSQGQGELPFRKIKSLADLQREVAAAQAAGKPLLFDFYADWCVACKEMEKYTFPDPAVHAALDGFVLLKADVTANDATDQQLMQELGIIGPPATLYYVDGAERRELRLFGFEAAQDFVKRAERVR